MNKIFASIGFFSLFFAALIAHLNPAAGYENSFYESTPSSVWVLLIISLIVGIIIIAKEIYSENYRSSHQWLIGLLLILVTKFLVLNLTSIRGYAFIWRGDGLQHIGIIRDLLSSGNVGDNFYPISHLLLAEITMLSGISVEIISKCFTSVLALFYLLFIYLLAKSIFNEKKIQILSVLGFAAIFNEYYFSISPNGWSILFSVIVFYFLFSTWTNARLEKNYLFLLNISLVLMPFFHILTALMLSFFLVFIFIINFFTEKYRKSIPNHVQNNNLLIYAGIGLCLLVSWILSFRYFYPNVQGLFEAATVGDKFSAVNEVATKLNKVDIQGFDLISLGLKIYGEDMILIFLSVIAIIIFYKEFIRKKQIPPLFLILVLNFSVIVLYLLYFFHLVPGLQFIAGWRLVMFLMLTLPLPVGYTLNYFFIRGKSLIPLICLLLAIASIISLLNLYSSPWIVQTNPQITYSDISGVTWLISFQNTEIEKIEIMSPPFLVAYEIEGIYKAANEDKFSNYDYLIPDHFNYLKNPDFGSTINYDSYAIITQYDKIIYQNVWKKVGRFVQSDFDKFEIDPTVDKLYNNGGYEIFYVRGKLPSFNN